MAGSRKSRSAYLTDIGKVHIEDAIRKRRLTVSQVAEECGLTKDPVYRALAGKPVDRLTLSALFAGLNLLEGGAWVTDNRSEEIVVTTTFNLPHLNNESFVGRETVLSEILSAAAKRNVGPVTQVISGIGGIGKTSVVVEFAYRCFSRQPGYPEYRYMLFARADSANVLRYEFARIAGELRLPVSDDGDVEEGSAAVIQWMKDPKSGPWLLILDSADEPQALMGLLPDEPDRHYGHILITSRSNRFPGRVQRLELAPMTLEDGISFLYRRTQRARVQGSNEEAAALRLVQTLGGMPLVLEQAAAYMTNAETMSFQDYLVRFQRGVHRSSLLMLAPELGFYRKFDPETREFGEALTALTTWHMSLKRLQDHHPEAVTLLRYSAFLQPSGIPKELVAALMPDYFQDAADDAIEITRRYNSILDILGRYSLIGRDLNNDTYSTHIMLQTVLRDELDDTQQSEMLLWICDAIGSSFPEDDFKIGGRGWLFLPHAEEAARTALARQLENDGIVKLLYSVGTFFDSNDDPIQAATAFDAALKMREKLSGPQDLQAGILCESLGVALTAQGRCSEAEILFRRAMAIRLASDGRVSEAVASIVTNLANCYRVMGQYRRARYLFLRALAIRKRTLGEKHINTAVSLNNLASIYSYEHQHGKAAGLLESALEVFVEFYGSHHQETATVQDNLAVMYTGLADFHKAETLFNSALAIRESSFGPCHITTAVTMNNRARLYSEMGLYEQARESYDRAYPVFSKVLGPDKHDTATVANNLSRVYRHLAQYEKSLEFGSQALRVRQSVLGEEHPATLVSLTDLACVYGLTGRISEAESMFRRAIEFHVRTRGIHVGDMRYSVRLFGEFLVREKRFEEAASLERAMAELL